MLSPHLLWLKNQIFKSLIKSIDANLSSNKKGTNLISLINYGVEKVSFEAIIFMMNDGIERASS